jgi:hypothetical protein
LDFAPELVLSQPLMAHLATASPEGPRDSPVWFHWEDGVIWLIGTSDDSFPARLRADPRCALNVVDFDAARGILRHVGIRGEATVLPMDRQRLHRLLARYLGPDQKEWNPWFQETIVAPLDLMIRITPASLIARDMSYFRTGPDFAR